MYRQPPMYRRANAQWMDDCIVLRSLAESNKIVSHHDGEVHAILLIRNQSLSKEDVV